MDGICRKAEFCSYHLHEDCRDAVLFKGQLQALLPLMSAGAKGLADEQPPALCTHAQGLENAVPRLTASLVGRWGRFTAWNTAESSKAKPSDLSIGNQAPHPWINGSLAKLIVTPESQLHEREVFSRQA